MFAFMKLHVCAANHLSHGPANAGVGDLSDDDVDIEEDDEYRRRKVLHDKKKRQAENVRIWCSIAGRMCSPRFSVTLISPVLSVNLVYQS